jgi:hypothetical protein
MKPLTNIASLWRDLIVAAFRFELVMNGEAVLDHETGLVWEKAPTAGSVSWVDAVGHCNGQRVGDRMGWRLPAIEELSTLVDPTQSNPALPPAHPFTGLHISPLDQYWTISNHPGDQGRNATQMSLTYGAVNEFVNDGDKEQGRGFVLCVRGGIGQNPDPKP